MARHTWLVVMKRARFTDEQFVRYAPLISCHFGPENYRLNSYLNATLRWTQLTYWISLKLAGWMLKPLPLLTKLILPGWLKWRGRIALHLMLSSETLAYLNRKWLPLCAQNLSDPLLTFGAKESRVEQQNMLRSEISRLCEPTAQRNINTSNDDEKAHYVLRRPLPVMSGRDFIFIAT